MYRYLLFDADHTLLDFDADMRIAFGRMYEASGLSGQRPLDETVLGIYNRCNERWWRRFEKGLCSKPELFCGRFADFFREAGLTPVDPEHLNALYFGALGESGTAYPGALGLMAELSREYELYIVTNGNAASQRTRLRVSGLMDYAKAYFISETAGAAKPDKRYFDYVLAHIPGAASKDCIVIGDSLTSDMLGAVNAGMDSIWYNPKHIENAARLPITFEAESYDDIRRILLNHAG